MYYIEYKFPFDNVGQQYPKAWIKWEKLLIAEAFILELVINTYFTILKRSLGLFLFSIPECPILSFDVEVTSSHQCTYIRIINIQTKRQINKQTDRQTDRQIDKQAGRQLDRQIGNQVDK